MFVVANLFVIISVASTSSAQAILSYLFPLAPSVFPRSLQKLERPLLVSLLKHEYNRTDCVVGIIQCDSCNCIIGDLVYFVRYIVFVG